MAARIRLYCFLLPLLVHASKILCLSGKWEFLVEDAGIASMHSAVTRYGTVILLDRQITVNPSGAETTSCVHRVPDSGHCIFPYSAEYDPVSNTMRPLDGILTDPWCSSGQFDPNGTLVQTGGYSHGSHRVRSLQACPPGTQCRWVESGNAQLEDPRWYATNQILPDGRQIVVGGRDAPNFEFVPPRRQGEEPTYLSMLMGQSKNTRDQAYYPFLHLLPDGTVFVLAGTDSVALDLKTNRPTRSFPPIDIPRTYPAGGSSVMLPLLASDGFSAVTILVCGASEPGAYWNKRGYNHPASASCGWIRVMDSHPAWKMEQMPVGRTMGDMVILPDGNVLIVNGAMRGSQGYNMASDPALTPVVYKPLEQRFELQNPTTVARMYHSTANLLPDGRVFVAGSNPHLSYFFSGSFPTEFRLEAFSPEYLNPAHDHLRLKIQRLDQRARYGSEFSVEISGEAALSAYRNNSLEVNLINAPFSTHSFSQGQRFLGLTVTSVSRQYYNNAPITVAQCEAPPKAAVAPPGYYMVFVVSNGIPSSSAQWIQIVP